MGTVRQLSRSGRFEQPAEPTTSQKAPAEIAGAIGAFERKYPDHDWKGSPRLGEDYPAYEIMPFITFGGPTTSYPYRLQSPFNTPGEFILIAFTFTAAGLAVLSTQANEPAPATTTVYDPSARRFVFPCASSAAALFPLPEIWQPLEGNGELYLTVSGASAVFATVAFRRKLDRKPHLPIPEEAAL
jgi:hypothetical protein